jgi:hypothetical protein
MKRINKPTLRISTGIAGTPTPAPSLPQNILDKMTRQPDIYKLHQPLIPSLSPLSTSSLSNPPRTDMKLISMTHTQSNDFWAKLSKMKHIRSRFKND